MKEEPDSLSVPYNFARCFNAQCPQAPKCLCHIATQLDTTDNLYITIINPARYPVLNSSCKCDTYLFHWEQLFRHRIIFHNLLLT